MVKNRFEQFHEFQPFQIFKKRVQALCGFKNQ